MVGAQMASGVRAPMFREFHISEYLSCFWALTWMAAAVAVMVVSSGV